MEAIKILLATLHNVNIIMADIFWNNESESTIDISLKKREIS